MNDAFIERDSQNRESAFPTFGEAGFTGLTNDNRTTGRWIQIGNPDDPPVLRVRRILALLEARIGVIHMHAKQAGTYVDVA